MVRRKTFSRPPHGRGRGRRTGSSLACRLRGSWCWRDRVSLRNQPSSTTNAPLLMSPAIEISQGKAFQLDGIAAIADAVALRSAGDLHRGFLLGSTDAAELLSLIESREVWVAELAGATVGFVIAHTDASQRFGVFRNRIPEIRWSAAPDFLDQPAVYVDRIAARPGYQGRGVGR